MRWIDGTGEIRGYSKIMRNRTDFKIMIDNMDAEIARLESNVERNRQMIAVIAHELRDPLAPILNVTQILRTQIGEHPVLTSALAILERQITALSQLVHDLLDSSRIEHKKIRCEIIPVDLSDLLTDVVDIMKPEFERRKQAHWLLLPPVPLVVQGAPIRLRQIFSNLLTNAIKYTPDGGKIYVRAMRWGRDCLN